MSPGKGNVYRVKVFTDLPEVDDFGISMEGVSLLLGVPVADLEVNPLTGKSNIPEDWILRGRRRAKEAMAHTGSDDMVSALEYWALKEHDARLELVYVGLDGGAAS
ncbi:hypothetical protein [Mycobacterium sp. pW045]|uniref:hypothetical protein n=1 Tax=Mycobacterium sp. pW045 TaxID=3238984 RepID=UPI00351B9159